MKVEHGNHPCEHCGAKVSTAPVCPCCGRDHSAIWIATAKKTDAATGFAMVFAMPYFIVKVLGIWNLPFTQFIDGLGSALLNTLIIGVVAMIVHMILFGIKPKDKEIENARKDPVL